MTPFLLLFIDADALVASTAGVWIPVNKIIVVRPLRSRYNADVGDFVDTRARTHTHTDLHTQTHTRARAHTHTHTHILSYTHAHTHTHTHTRTDALVASTAGVVDTVNKLIVVRPLRSRYNAEVGDVVVGRITEVCNNLSLPRALSLESMEIISKAKCKPHSSLAVCVCVCA